MLQTLARRWWMLVVRGVAAILFGILTFAEPTLSLSVLLLFFGVWAIVDGVFAFASAIQSAHGGQVWGALVLEGLIGLAVGVVALVWTGLTALALLFVIAGWMVVTGIAELAAAIRLRKLIKGEWLLGLEGLLSVVGGLLLWLFPSAGALALVWWIGAYAIVFGVLLIALGLRLRSWAHRPERRFPTGIEVPA